MVISLTWMINWKGIGLNCWILFPLLSTPVLSSGGILHPDCYSLWSALVTFFPCSWVYTLNGSLDPNRPFIFLASASVVYYYYSSQSCLCLAVSRASVMDILFYLLFICLCFPEFCFKILSVYCQVSKEKKAFFCATKFFLCCPHTDAG